MRDKILLNSLSFQSNMKTETGKVRRTSSHFTVSVGFLTLFSHHDMFPTCWPASWCPRTWVDHSGWGSSPVNFGVFVETDAILILLFFLLHRFRWYMLGRRFGIFETFWINIIISIYVHVVYNLNQQLSLAFGAVHHFETLSRSCHKPKKKTWTWVVGRSVWETTSLFKIRP